MKRVLPFITLFIVLAMISSACSVLSTAANQLESQATAIAGSLMPQAQPTDPTAGGQAPSGPTAEVITPEATSPGATPPAFFSGPITPVPSATMVSPANPTNTASQASGAAGVPNTGSPEAIAAVEGALEAIYNKVNPSVVSIQVLSQGSSANGNGNGGSPFGNQGNGVSASAGSGFIWDTNGHIVTNNHVIDGATQIDVSFFDGSTVRAKLVGADPDSDLAVIQVNVPADLLHPVTLADSKQVKVGELAVAIGNPFTLSGSMTVGIVSGLNRTLPSDNTSSSNSQAYQIPDIIQTDASINPGNSGGVLVDIQGNVIGVTSAIESPVQSSSGVGFVIPSTLVSKVVPSLISTGKYLHSWMGISGVSLDPDISQAMNLNPGQRGALIEDVTPGGPGDKAGLHASTQSTTILGQSFNVGGDVIIAVDGTPIRTMDELIAYMADNTEPGQTVKLTIIRGGQQSEVSLTLGERPPSNSSTSPSSSPTISP